MKKWHNPVLCSWSTNNDPLFFCWKIRRGDVFLLLVYMYHPLHATYMLILGYVCHAGLEPPTGDKSPPPMFSNIIKRGEGICAQRAKHGIVSKKYISIIVNKIYFPDSSKSIFVTDRPNLCLIE